MPSSSELVSSLPLLRIVRIVVVLLLELERGAAHGREPCRLLRLAPAEHAAHTLPARAPRRRPPCALPQLDAAPRADSERALRRHRVFDAELQIRGVGDASPAAGEGGEEWGERRRVGREGEDADALRVGENGREEG